MQFYIIALALIGIVAADVSHLQHGHDESSFSTSRVSRPGGDSSSYQPEQLFPQHLKAAHEESASASSQIIPGGDSSSYQPEHLISKYLTAPHEETANAAVIPASFNIGADTQTPEQFIPEADRIAHYSYSHLQAKALDPPHVESASAAVILGGDSSSYQPEHLIPQHLKVVEEETASAAVLPESFNIGADTQTPEQFIPEADRVAQNSYTHFQAKSVLPGGDSSSYQPEHLIPQHLKVAHEESASASAEIIPGGDSSSYQPEQSATAAILPKSFNIGADTQTPEQFIPEADRIAHYSYTHSQAKAVLPTPVESAVFPGGDSSSYQPEHLIPQHLKAAHEEYASSSTEIIHGGDSSSYQPEQSATAAILPESFNIGADTQTPEQFIPEADRIAHYSYTHSQAKAVLPTPVESAVFPGGDSSSYQPEHLIPQYLKAAHVESATAEIIPEPFTSQDAREPVQEQVPVVIGANTITPAHLYQEPVSNGIEEFNAESHVPIAIGGDTIERTQLQSTYSSSVLSSASSRSTLESGTQYATNGGYVY